MQDSNGKIVKYKDVDPHQYSIIAEVDAVLVARSLNNDRDYTVFHPSEWDGCHRKIAYSYYYSKGFLDLEKNNRKVDTKLERIFGNGHYTHDRWRDYVESTGRLRGLWRCSCGLKEKSKSHIYGTEEKLGIARPSDAECGCTSFTYEEVGFCDKETNWSGHVDVIIALTSDLNIIIDFKTMNPYQFQKLAKPLPKHITQMQIYLYLSGLSYGMFLYEDKSDQSVKEYLVERDDDLIAVKREEAIQLKHLVTHTNSSGNHVLPPRGYDMRSSYGCRGCSFRSHCWSK